MTTRKAANPAALGGVAQDSSSLEPNAPRSRGEQVSASGPELFAAGSQHASRPAGQVPDDLVELGRIVDAYGLRGWVKVQPHSAQSEVLLAAKRWWLKPSAKAGAAASQAAASRKVKLSRTQGTSVVAALDGVADRTDAEQMKGMLVLVARSDFPVPDDGEYYWVDLMGCRVWGVDDADGQVEMGEVVDVIDNGAHSVLSVRRQHEREGKLVDVVDEKGRPQLTLVPFVDAHLLEVDLPGKRIVTNWPLDF